MAFADRTEAGWLLAAVVARHFAASSRASGAASRAPGAASRAPGARSRGPRATSGLPGATSSPAGAASPASPASGAGAAARRPLVLALPRGGVPVAIPIAQAIDADLDVVIARKIGAPGQPELGIGALAEDGPPLVDRAAMASLRLTDADIAPVVVGERTELARRTRRYRGDRPAPAVDGRTVVLVDDGLATGVTALAAVDWIRSRDPARLIVATPVCSRPARQAVATRADAVICLQAPRRFRAVGAWYDDFSQLTDDDVIRALAARKTS